MPATAAIHYKPDGFDTSGRRVMGRQSAGEGFLKAFARAASSEVLYCHTEKREFFEDFEARVRRWSGRERTLRFLPSSEPEKLAEAGTLHVPAPGLNRPAWVRRFCDQRAYALTGVVHALCTREAMREIGDMLLSPLQPWDALVCTTECARQTVLSLFEDYSAYLSQRLGAAPKCPARLPVIPLGVDAEVFAALGDDLDARQRLRSDAGIGPEDVAVLFLGRLNFYAKAHPVPMFEALERSAANTGKRVCLLMVGWFENEREQQAFHNAAGKFCPSIHTVFLDSRNDRIRQSAWAAADIFASLADNVQETFGLAPVEAMAAGLPVVASDWNGYRESVRHGLDGLLLPTVAPEAGHCLDLGRDYENDAINYSMYIAYASFATAVDVEACEAAFTALIGDPDLRRRMGESGRQRAFGYDWKAVIREYETLWAELEEIRAKAKEVVPKSDPACPSPLLGDPFRAFGHYPVASLSLDTALEPGPSRHDLAGLEALWITAYGASRRVDGEKAATAAALARQKGRLTARELIRAVDPDNEFTQAAWMKTIGYLLKFGVLRLS